ncbi:HAMP domain-containing sensor histidine kinase [Haliovirga abyssi]|uniref:histidine kinase n=1 Tax=Haliovirga abyssi TaxID=2996794 RepID=A0AAU9DTM8_9FUSO|nr:sensor histidine kinase [Haliovirga abyssi]BDU50544.1 hypothetical protein HLVA_11130 [Haliovirga abyssi]
MKKLTLREKIVVFSALFIIIPSIFITIVSIKISTGIIETQMNNNREQLLLQIKSDLDNKLSSVESVIVLLNNDIKARDIILKKNNKAEDSRYIRNMLKNIVTSEGDIISSISVYSYKNNNFFSYGDVKYNPKFKSEEWNKNSLSKNGGFYYGLPNDISDYDNINWPTIVVGKAFYFSNGKKPDFVMKILLRMEFFTKFINKTFYGKNSKSFIINNSGKMIVCGEQSNKIKFYKNLDEISKKDNFKNILKKVNVLKTKENSYVHIHNGKYVVYMVNFSGNSWSLVSAIPTNNITSELKKIIWIVLIILIITIVIETYFLFLFFYKELISPLNEILAVIKNFKISGIGNIKMFENNIKKNELEQIKIVILEMMQEIQNNYKDIQLNNNELKEIHIKLENKINELKELGSEKDSFLERTSYELISNLENTLAIIEVLFNKVIGQLTKEQEYNLKMIYANINKLMNTTNDVLELSKLKKNKIKLDIEDFNIKNIVDNEIKNLNVYALNKNLEISNNITEDIYVRGDKVRVKKIFYNLIENSIKFTKKGNVEISYNILKDKNRIEISISDTGVGIKKEMYSLIFDSFEKSYKMFGEREKLKGLGLYVVKKIVEAHGEELKIDSKIGVGTKISFILTLSESSKN